MRDLPGLAILFLMPLMLIIVITLTQENAMDSVNGANIDILFINHDKSTIGNLIQEGLESSNEINLVRQYKNRPLSDSMLSLLVAKGEFKAGIIIPENTSLDATQKVIADLSNLDQIEPIHVAEALQYRTKIE